MQDLIGGQLQIKKLALNSLNLICSRTALYSTLKHPSLVVSSKIDNEHHFLHPRMVDEGGDTGPVQQKRKAKNRASKTVLSFNEAGRVEYLTGFRKRKVSYCTIL